MKKVILFTYSGKDRFQNAVACSTRQYIQEKLNDYFAILLLNIDKINTIKHLKDKRYDIIYISENLQELCDELLDEHKDKFDSIVQYNTLESRVYSSGYGGYSKSTCNKIAQDLEKVVRDNSKTLTKYSYSKYGKVVISKKFKEYDFNKLGDYEARDYFDSKEKCILNIKRTLEKQVAKLIEELDDKSKELEIVNRLLKENY